MLKMVLKEWEKNFSARARCRRLSPTSILYFTVEKNYIASPNVNSK